MNVPKTIETTRLLLKRPVHAHAKEMAVLANNKLVSENLATMPYPYQPDDAIFWINGVTDMVGGFAVSIFLKITGQLIGCCGSGPVDDSDEIDFGYWIDPQFWGKGYATEAGSAVLNQVFGHDRYEKITTDYQTENLASARVLEKLGFRAVGARKKFSVSRNAEMETVMVCLDRNDWLQHRLCTIGQESIRVIP